MDGAAYSPLLAACEWGLDEAAAALLEHGADPHFEGEEAGYTLTLTPTPTPTPTLALTLTLTLALTLTLTLTLTLRGGLHSPRCRRHQRPPQVCEPAARGGR